MVRNPEIVNEIKRNLEGRGLPPDRAALAASVLAADYSLGIDGVARTPSGTTLAQGLDDWAARTLRPAAAQEVQALPPVPPRGTLGRAALDQAAFAQANELALPDLGEFAPLPVDPFNPGPMGTPPSDPVSQMFWRAAAARHSPAAMSAAEGDLRQRYGEFARRHGLG